MTINDSTALIQAYESVANLRARIVALELRIAGLDEELVSRTHERDELRDALNLILIEGKVYAAHNKLPHVAQTMYDIAEAASSDNPRVEP